MSRRRPGAFILPARTSGRVVLRFVTVLVNRATGQKPAEPEMEAAGGGGPVN